MKSKFCPPPRHTYKKLHLIIIAALTCGSAGADPVDWVGASGQWNVPANWSSNPFLPGSPDDVAIGVGAPQTVTHDAGDDAINSLATNAAATLIVNGGSSLSIWNGGSNAGKLQAGGASVGTLGFNGGTLNNAGGSLTAAASGLINFNGVTVSGGTLDTSGTGRISAANNSNNVLDAATVNGTLDLASAQGFERVTNGLTLNGRINVNNQSLLVFQGNQTVGGSGSIVFGDTAGNNQVGIEGNSTLTLGSGILAHGQNGVIGTNTLVNQGTIAADVSGGAINLNAASTVNNGALQALNGGTLYLNGHITGGVGGHINAGAGSSVVQNGVSLSGDINITGAGSFVVTGNDRNVLDAVTLNGALDLATAPGQFQSIEHVTNGLALNGSINLDNNSVLTFQGDQTLGGSGHTLFFC